MKIVLHAPSIDGVRRARSNALNLAKDFPDLEVKIVINADGVPAALDQPDEKTDALLLVCRNTLAKLGREAAPHLTTVASGVMALAQMQVEGWTYIRS